MTRTNHSISPLERMPGPMRHILMLLMVASVACSHDPVSRNSIDMDFVLIPAGAFDMGSESGEPDERPIHRVQITQPFYLGTFEVTQAQWDRVMGLSLDAQRKLREANLPLNGVGDEYPMYFVSHGDAVAFTKRLNTLENTNAYRLPTEAEWEYACRAGVLVDDPEKLDDMAWYGANASGGSHPVGQKEPNQWGLYDMKGNVWEWCSDWLDRAYYAKGDMVDPTGGPPGERRIIRGGGWYSDPDFLRSTHRNYTSPGSGGPHLGFRVVKMITSD